MSGYNKPLVSMSMRMTIKLEKVKFRILPTMVKPRKKSAIALKESARRLKMGSKRTGIV